MRKISENTLIIIFPFLIIVLVNEFMRTSLNESHYLFNGLKAINSDEFLPGKCTWACHNNTHYCEVNHVKILKSYRAETDRQYFGLINLLRKTSNYELSNIISLAILIPLLIGFFIIKSIDIQKRIHRLKRQKQTL